ncbi:MAG TPA: DUF1264 domain-containing protein [Candidatus Binatia bacterium]|nr:DUF1264 domain-containing protein [Candidatus Binatia bacterium]
MLKRRCGLLFWVCITGLSAYSVAQAGAPQARIPIEQLQIYVDGFHNYTGEDAQPAERQTQMRVSHYCQALPSGVIQCAIFDGTTRNAHLIGVEHIISDQAYQQLPEKEKAFWHPHDGEVDSGMLALPGMAPDKANELKRMIRSTHGKTWHVWDTDSDSLPLGQPRLMWAVPPKDMNTATKAAIQRRDQDATFGPE